MGAPHAAQAQNHCGGHVCATAGTRLLSVSTERSVMLNALLSSLTGASIKLSVADYNALATTELKLDNFLAALKADLTVVNYTDVLTANVTLDTVLKAAASALATQDGQAAADVLGALLLVALPDQTFALGDMLRLDLRGNALATSVINVLDLVTGTASLFNHRNAITVENVSVTGAALGLGSLIQDLDLGVTVPVPPVYACGPEGTSFRSASLRLRLRVRLVNVSTSLVNLVDLGLLSAGVAVGNLDLVLDIAPGLGVLQSIDAVNAAVTVRATPGVVSLYLGTVSDANLLDRTTPIDPATELGFAAVASLSVSVLNKPISVVSVKARGFAVGDDSSPEDLVFTAPYPKSLTAVTQGDFLSSLVQDLLNSLEVQIGTIANVTNNVANAVIGQVTNLLKGVGNLLVTPLNAVASNVLNPLLHTLGIGLGELDVSICAAPLPIPEGTPCDDGMYCTANEVCDGHGHCAGGFSPCEDPGNVCLRAVCSESSQSCSTDFAGCMIEGSCVPAGPVAGTCMTCDPTQSVIDLVPTPGCAGPAGEQDGGVPMRNGSGCGGGEFCDGGTLYLDGGDPEGDVDISGEVKVGLAGGSRCAIAPYGRRSADAWMWLLVTCLFLQRAHARTKRNGKIQA